MVLGFKTHIKQRPTHFVQKILACVLTRYRNAYVPKLHTIREGTGRWKKGMFIHMCTGVRTKNYNQFNTDLPDLQRVISVQKICIYRVDDLPKSSYDGTVYEMKIDVKNLDTFCIAFRVKIDDTYLDVEDIKRLSINDGFATVDDFFAWFNYDDFTGTLIHWTNKKY